MQKASFIGLVFFGTMFFAGSAAPQPIAVTTYHNDNLRTGWNQQETTLTQQNVTQTTFGVLATAVLDDQVDAQPLIVPGLTIAGGKHDVVFIETESNTIYALDASTGVLLLKTRNLGTPVPRPFGCVHPPKRKRPGKYRISLAAVIDESPEPARHHARTEAGIFQLAGELLQQIEGQHDKYHRVV
jgi:hypothetical protein